jgi:hypothetical protein
MPVRMSSSKAPLLSGAVPSHAQCVGAHGEATVDAFDFFPHWPRNTTLIVGHAQGDVSRDCRAASEERSEYIVGEHFKGDAYGRGVARWCGSPVRHEKAP